MVHISKTRGDAFETVHISETHDDAFETSTRSVGCVAALLPRISLTNWYTKRRQEKADAHASADTRFSIRPSSAVSNSKARAEDKSARQAPFILEIGDTDPVATPILDAEEAWSEMARRFHDAHPPAARAASVPTSAQRNARAAIGAQLTEVGRTLSQ